MHRSIHAGRVALGTVAAAAFLSSSCASTKISDVWATNEPPAGTFERLMIVALTPTQDLRGQYENDFVDKLSNAHVIAVASINVIPNVQDIDRKTVEAWLEEFRLDGIVLTRLTDIDRQTEYIPPSYTLAGWYGGWAVPVQTSPGRVIEHTQFFLETDLFDAKTEKLVYSAVTKTSDPDSRREAVHAVIDILVKDMTKRGYLPGS